MEDPSQKTDSVSVSSDIAHLRHRQTDPDVPESIEDENMLHFNDPNWDFRDNFSTLSISTDGVESQRISKISSHISSWHIHDPKADFSSKGQIQLRVLSLPYCVAFCSPT